jgi:hypothetical protein
LASERGAAARGEEAKREKKLGLEGPSALPCASANTARFGDDASVTA